MRSAGLSVGPVPALAPNRGHSLQRHGSHPRLPDSWGYDGRAGRPPLPEQDRGPGAEAQPPSGMVQGPSYRCPPSRWNTASCRPKQRRPTCRHRARLSWRHPFREAVLGGLEGAGGTLQTVDAAIGPDHQPFLRLFTQDAGDCLVNIIDMKFFADESIRLVLVGGRPILLIGMLFVGTLVASEIESGVVSGARPRPTTWRAPPPPAVAGRWRTVARIIGTTSAC